MNNSTSAIYLQRLGTLLQQLDIAQIDNAIALITKAWKAGQQIIVFGNGGSALTAQHYVTDWNKSIYLSTNIPFHGRCLAENMGLITAYANDLSYQDIFVAQLKPMMKPNDLVIGISGSGNSENVLRAIQYANDNQGVTLGICGYNGGKLKTMAQHHLHSDVNDMQLSEDAHMIFCHIVMQTLCGYITPQSKPLEKHHASPVTA